MYLLAPKLRVRGLVHGDDFVFSGDHEDVHWVRQALAKKFEIKSKVIETSLAQSKSPGC